MCISADLPGKDEGTHKGKTTAQIHLLQVSFQNHNHIFFLELLRMFKRILEQQRELYCSKKSNRIIQREVWVIVGKLITNFLVKYNFAIKFEK